MRSVLRWASARFLFVGSNLRVPLKILSSPKCKAREKFCRAAYGLYVSKKFFSQRSSWDEIWIFRGAHLWMW